MPSVRPGARAAAALLTVVALAAACGTDADTRPDAVGPGSAYVELVLGTTGDVARQQAVQFEEIVSACMAEAGFEYLPNLSAHGFFDEADLEQPRDSREFAELYGYGYASMPEGSTMTLGPEDDPNTPILAAMSDAELAAYEEAIAGTMATSGGEEPDWESSGCYGRATVEVYRSGPVVDGTYLALQEELDRIEADRIPADPDVAAADVAWSACMADAGYPGHDRQPDAETSWVEHFQAEGGGGGEIGPKLDALIATLTAEEVALATADWDCADQVGYHGLVARVRDEAEQEYVDAHRDELDAWVERWTEE